MLSSDAVKARAREVGFDLCGISPAVAHDRLGRLRDWIARGYAGEMRYLERSLDERLDPRAVLPTARSVISLAVVYNTDQPYSTQVSGAEAGTAQRAAISRYAWGDDYHDVLRGRVRDVLRWMSAAAGPGLEACSTVDDGPVQERVFAEQAGLGWIGKNTCVIHPALGSWLFLATILTNAELEPDAPSMDQCGTCTRCIEACPTGAIAEPYLVDATRCLSYLTIEVREEIDSAMRPAVREQIVGCDICQDVCPWNRRAVLSDDPAWQARQGLAFPSLVDLCAMSDADWRARLKGSAMRRAGLRRIRRSLAYAAAHLPEPERAAALDALAAQPTGQDPLVAGAIVWARNAR